MQDIYFLNYNNYYNRQVKNDGDYLSAYEPYIIDSLLNTNFNPNDGITTTHITGYWDHDYICNYLLVFETGTTFSPISRWFVIESVRLAEGQLQLSLVRDIIAENYQTVLKSPCYIEKGWVPDTDSAIFNSEGLLVNQIKKGEYVLENKLKTPWIVAYLSRYKNKEDGEREPTLIYNSYSGTFKQEVVPRVDEELNDLTDYQYYNLTSTKYKVPSDLYFGTQFKKIDNHFDTYVLAVNSTKSTYFVDFDKIPSSTLPTSATIPTIANPAAAYEDIYNDYKSYYVADSNGVLVNSLTGFASESLLQTLKNENRKVLKVGEVYYRVGYKKTSSEIAPVIVSPSVLPLAATMSNNLALGYLNLSGKTTVNEIRASGVNYVETYELTIEKINLNAELEYSFSYGNGAATMDAEYEIIATPYNSIDFILNDSVFRHDGNVALQWFQSIANKYNAAGWCYDIQLVPYCSIDDYTIDDYDRITCTQDGISLAVAFKLPAASFEYKGTINIPLNADVKIGNETELYRITSPNGIGNFDFSPYKNEGFSEYQADITLLPINPYIKISPIFKGLYGKDFNDYRGLICSGDFSLAITSNQWQTYALNNKYYQEIFNRQIENIDTKNNLMNEYELASIYTNAVSGGISGAMGGLYSSSAPAAALMGGIGYGLSYIGGQLDYQYNTALRREEKNYTVDMYNYSLQTIKAKADTLTRTTSYNINNKYFPYIEYFCCSEEEINALKNKIKYNGMTIMRIGAIEDYLKEGDETYIKAKLIRWIPINSAASEDFHHINIIAAELDKGVFITK